MFLLQGRNVLFRSATWLVGRVRMVVGGLWVEVGWVGVLSAACFVLPDGSGFLEDGPSVRICFAGIRARRREGVPLARYWLGLLVRLYCVGLGVCSPRMWFEYPRSSWGWRWMIMRQVAWIGIASE